MYERLTKRDRYGHAYTNETIYDRGMTSEDGVHFEKHYFENGTSAYDGNPIDRLCEIEDKICEGKIVELPCKVGQTVYCIRYDKARKPFVKPLGVCSVTVWGKGGFTVFTTKEDSWGVTAFATEEEANKKLKELAK